MTAFLPLLAALAAYLIGSLSFAVIVSRAMGLADPRSYGSGNPGATNVLRSGNKAAAIADAAARCAEGLRAGAAGAAVRRRASAWARATVALVGLGRLPRPPLAGVLPLPGRQGRGHRGRRAARHQPAGSALATLATWVIIAAFFRYSSLASIVSAVFAPFYQLLIWGAEPIAAGDRRDGPAAGLAPQRQHPQAARRHREQARSRRRRRRGASAEGGAAARR